MQIIPDWRRAWKFFCIQLALVGAALQGAVLAFPGLRDWLGDAVTHWVGLLILAGVVLGRMVDQRKRDDQAP